MASALGFFFCLRRLRQRQSYTAAHVRRVRAGGYIEPGFLAAVLAPNNDDGRAIRLRGDSTRLCADHATGGTRHRETNYLRLRHAKSIRYCNLWFCACRPRNVEYTRHRWKRIRVIPHCAHDTVSEAAQMLS